MKSNEAVDWQVPSESTGIWRHKNGIIFHSLFNYLVIHLFFICLLILLKNKGLHKMGDLVPCFITRRNVSQRFQRYEGGQTPQARRSTNYPSTWLAASELNFMPQLMKIIVTFQPNDFCVSKLHGFDPKFSEESFKAGLKLVGCAVKELWIFKLFHLISFKLIYSSFIYLFYLFIFH